MSEIYGWTPKQISELTLFQMAAYMGGITPEHGRVKVKPEEAKAIINRRQAKRAGIV